MPEYIVVALMSGKVVKSKFWPFNWRGGFPHENDVEFLA